LAGEVTELRFTLWCARRDFDVFRPVFPNQKGFDFLVDFQWRRGFERVQVKTVSVVDQGGGNVYYQLGNSTGGKGRLERYSPSAYDWMAAICPDAPKMWLIPRSTFGDRWTMRQPHSGQRLRPNMRSVDLSGCECECPL
jgi:hypothetical protein